MGSSILMKYLRLIRSKDGPSRAAKSDELSSLVEAGTRLEFDLAGVVKYSTRDHTNFSRARVSNSLYGNSSESTVTSGLAQVTIPNVNACIHFATFLCMYAHFLSRSAVIVTRYSGRNVTRKTTPTRCLVVLASENASRASQNTSVSPENVIKVTKSVSFLRGQRKLRVLASGIVPTHSITVH